MLAIHCTSCENERQYYKICYRVDCYSWTLRGVSVGIWINEWNRTKMFIVKYKDYICRWSNWIIFFNQAQYKRYLCAMRWLLLSHVWRFTKAHNFGELVFGCIGKYFCNILICKTVAEWGKSFESTAIALKDMSIKI